MLQRARAGRVAFQVAIVVLAIMVSGGSASGLASGPAKCSWRQVLAVPGGWFNDVASVGDTVWVVGYRTARGSNKTYPLTSTWDGRSWSTSVGRGVGKHEDVLAGVSGDVWIEGVRDGRSVLHRFDGRTWATSFRDVTFADVQRSGSIWMREGRHLIRVRRGGQANRLALPSSIEEEGAFTTDAGGRAWVDDRWEQFYRWDGHRWSVHRYPGTVSLLSGMATGRPSNVWAVGNEIAHWDGSSWKQFRAGGESQVLHDVDALADKALAVGQDWGHRNVHGVVAEWDGKTLRTSYVGRRSPNNPRDCPACDISTVEALNGVAFTTVREAWAVGYGNAGTEIHGVVFRGGCRW